MSYGLGENDIQALIALADENKQGYIEWEKFIDVGIDCIKAFFTRNKALQRAKATERELNKEQFKLLYKFEIN